MKLKRTLQIEGLDVAENINILNVASLERLSEMQTRNEFLLETANEVFLLKPGVVLRYVKPEAKPTILQAKEIRIESCSAKVMMDTKELLDFALRNNIPCFETPNEFVVVSDITLVAPKEKPQ